MIISKKTSAAPYPCLFKGTTYIVQRSHYPRNTRGQYERPDELRPVCWTLLIRIQP